ncbi:hypothetical protein Bcav_0863 [Beutenbergia cavernae DSM 12333]|uniref:DUF2530 domain-containing protein n=1 Tax=Beutenbergia cavernae (strain ATCC BAA-8 / DSM 12333 / CCUG 43141 / JCM 11478 / NBRC 16432 / NCIMB 13614 / HKI 0122) TaxID=471853 RepID=C5BZF2_BEUC1|nr:DUF2530 domain-containing protein [Beutenbergia cavernae]ACQ79124.1 hypothetical protein Bcav_0863 [Beutenbergia cavernae DSM 12333]
MSDDPAGALVPPPRRERTLERAHVDLRGVLAAGTALWLAALVVLAILDAAGVGVPRLGAAVCALGAASGVVGYAFAARSARRS